MKFTLLLALIALAESLTIQRVESENSDSSLFRVCSAHSECPSRDYCANGSDGVAEIEEGQTIMTGVCVPRRENNIACGHYYQCLSNHCMIYHGNRGICVFGKSQDSDALTFAA